MSLFDILHGSELDLDERTVIAVICQPKASRFGPNVQVILAPTSKQRAEQLDITSHSTFENSPRKC